MTALARLHIAKKQLGLDEDTYRAVLQRVTGKASAKLMSDGERQLVLIEFERLGFKPSSKAAGKSGAAAGKRLSGPYAGKLQALWIAGWNLGLVRDRRDSALLAFVERQTGLQSTAWLRDPTDARKAIEALKAWLTRDGGVRWEMDKDTPEWARRHGYQIARAQFARLNGAWSAGLFWMAVAQALGRGAILGPKPTDAEWIEVMNTFGVSIRATTGKAGS